MLQIQINEGPSTAGPITEIIGELIRDIAKSKVSGILAETHTDIILAKALLACTREKLDMLDRLGLISADEYDDLEACCDAAEIRINECELDIKKAKLCNGVMRRTRGVARDR